MGFENGWMARATLRAQATGQEMVNVLNYDMRSSFADRDLQLQALADRLKDDVLPTFKALFGPSWTIDPVLLQEIRDPLNPNAIREAVQSGSAGAGTRVPPAGDIAPWAMCRVHTLKTGAVGRRFRGRLFVGGSVYESDIIGNNFVAPAASNFAFLADAFVDSIPREPDIIWGASNATVNWVVYSRTQRAQSLDGYSNDVLSTIPRSQIRWLRSREPGN